MLVHQILSPQNAFTFLQTVLIDDVLANPVTASNWPFLGYISIRVCPQTNTLMGMQQYGPYSVMIEVVAYRSPLGGRECSRPRASDTSVSTTHGTLAGRSCICRTCLSQ